MLYNFKDTKGYEMEHRRYTKENIKNIAEGVLKIYSDQLKREWRITINFTEEVLANIEFVRTTSAKTQDKIVEVMAFTIKNEEDERLYLLEIGCSPMYFSFTLSSFFEEKLITYWSKRIGYHTKNNMELVNYVLNLLVPHKPDEFQLIS